MAVSVETKASDEAAVAVALAPTATEVAQEGAPTLMPPATPEAAAAVVSTEAPAVDTASDPAPNVITLLHDVPTTEPKAVADGDGEDHERARVA